MKIVTPHTGLILDSVSMREVLPDGTLGPELIEQNPEPSGDWGEGPVLPEHVDD